MAPNDFGSSHSITRTIEDNLVQARIPGATYRLQLGQGFTFSDAQALIPYLREMGFTDIYLSPFFKARPGSTHGYDICDHNQFNPAIGDGEDFATLAREVQSRDMGLIIDLVPNHTGIGDVSNVWWMDVLENGPSSVYAHYFDIDWSPDKRELANKVLLPVLEDQYGRVLESSKLTLAYEDGAFFIYYYENKLPVAPCTYSMILGHRLNDLLQTLGEETEHLQEFQSILTALSYLPPREERDPDRIAERNREKEVIKRRISALYSSSDQVHSAIDQTVEEFNGTPGIPVSYDLLDALLDAQVYRPAFWRVAAEEINYRRFFDINDLAAIRVELPEVFQSVHRLAFQILSEGLATGVRIDHADGLWDPRQYLLELQRHYVLSRVRAKLTQEERPPFPSIEPTESPRWIEGAFEDKLVSAHLDSLLGEQLERSESWTPSWPLYVVAEKILGEGEQLPNDWAAYGTTGYDFLNALNRLFVDSRGHRPFARIYNRFSGNQIRFRDLLYSSKMLIMQISLASEVNALGHLLDRISEGNRRYRDFTLQGLTAAVTEVIACLSVYRTYVSQPGTVTFRDQRYVEAAAIEAKRRRPRAGEAIDFVRDTILLRNLDDFSQDDQLGLVNWVMRLQQVSSPAMAKGMEDTALYVFNRLVSLNDVGGNPDHFGGSIAAFHQQNAERRRYWPHSMLATSTHDTKRSEDVRANIHVLSEIPEEWSAGLNRWMRLNRAKRTSLSEGETAPDSNDEYLLYQTLVGVWPTESSLSPEQFAGFRDRITDYMLKATKEAKVHTSWVSPSEDYDLALREFIHSILPDGGADSFLDDFRPFQRRVAYYGRFNALSQILLKLTSPGVPDTYQGTELWDLTLVDPDNRRPVDFAHRQQLLSQLLRRIGNSDGDLVTLASELVDSSHSGLIKLYMIYRTLNLRSARPRLFGSGAYQQLRSSGYRHENVCAFCRVLDSDAVVTVVPRLVVRLTGGVERPPQGAEVWKDTWLALPGDRPGQTYVNAFTGENIVVSQQRGVPGLPLASVLRHFPVALLERMRQCAG